MTIHRARKRFGQHFLCDQGVIGQIIDAIAPQTDDALVEIGPGLSALTQPLLERLSHLTVIELDRDLAKRLRAMPRLAVIEQDALTVDYEALAKSVSANENGKIRVVGNLPYNISSPLLFHLMRSKKHIIDQHFMLQKEVVDRMVAEPSNKDYGRLTVMLQCSYQMESLIDVLPNCFDPPPRVNSSIVRMTPSEQFANVNQKLLGEMVKVAFSQRRKLLRHTLGVWLGGYNYQGNFDLQRRAEEVPVVAYCHLALEMEKSITRQIG